MMDPEQHARLSELFARASKLPPDKRKSFLDRACGEDADLRAEIESLLAHEEQAAELFGTLRETTRTIRPTSRAEGERIGPYRILQRVGEGGMGVVYLAEQERPVRRRVALKLIKRGMDTRRVVARFEAERQALAMMDHPSIAHVLDAGATERGRPYFVMEFVKGRPITEYCDHHRLSNVERLELFVQVCDGVQHAHQKGIIHRDLKPSNVLVQVQDGRPVPKIIDFGVAKAVSHRLTSETVYTEYGELIGTPEYMSPEQAEMTTLDIDTRSDVYSLGALLYELLVGVPPFDRKTLGRATLDELRRRIREEEPSRPSARLSTLGEGSGESARKRRSEPSALARQLRGDLDWITIKALAKDRTRRYGSPTELAEDVRRHLRHEPVSAGPPSAAYRVGKFVRRNKVAVAAGVVVAAAMIVGSLLATVGMIRAARAEQVARAEADNARRQAETAHRISEFLVDLFQVADPSESRANTVTARELLDRGADKITEELSGQPLTRAQLIHTMGRVYQSLGLLERAETLLRDALAIRERELGGDTPELADSLEALGWLLQNTGSFAEAEEFHRRALEVRERAIEPDDSVTATTVYYLAVALARQGRHDEAEPYYRRAMSVFEQELGPEDQKVGWCLNDLAVILDDRGEWQAAADLFERALEIKERAVGPDHLDVGRTAINLGQIYCKLDRPARARALVERSVEIHKQTLGSEHPEYAGALLMSSLLYARLGLLEEAESAQRRSVQLLTASFGADNPDVLYNQACYEALVGQRERALDYLRQAIRAGFRSVAAEHDPDLVSLRGDPEFEAIVGSGS